MTEKPLTLAAAIKEAEETQIACNLANLAGLYASYGRRLERLSEERQRLWDLRAEIEALKTRAPSSITEGEVTALCKKAWC